MLPKFSGITVDSSKKSFYMTISIHQIRDVSLDCKNKENHRKTVARKRFCVIL